MRKVLFVDDEPNVLNGLRRSLRPMHKQWDTAFATSADEALGLLAERAFDVVVTDMRMPGKDGADLLLDVKTRYPRVARIVLSGQTEHKDGLRSVASAHRFLAKPCDVEVLKNAIESVCELRERLSSEALLSAVTGLAKLPSLPESYQALMREVQSQSATAQTVAGIVTQDLAMSAKVLQLVNSAFFGLTSEVADIERAVALLGVETINALLVSRAAFDSFDGANLADLESLWRESLLVAQAARSIAECEGASLPVKHAAYEAGLMHDIGRLVLATAAPAGAAQAASLVADGGRSIGDAEQEVFGCDHGIVGAYLLDLWGLPPGIVEAVAYHHRPMESSVDTFGPLVAVHAANALLAEVRSSQADFPGLDREWLARIGIDRRVPVWRDRLEALAVRAS